MKTKTDTTTAKYYTFEIDCAQRCKFITVLGTNPADARLDAYSAVRSALGLSARLKEGKHGFSFGPDLNDEQIDCCRLLNGGHWAWLGYP